MLCYDAGKPYTVSPFNLLVRAKRGVPNNELVKQITEKKYGAIQTDTPVTQKPSPRFPDEVLDAIDRYYVEALKAPECHIYVPHP